MRQFYIILSFILSLPLFASAQLHYPIRTTTIVTPPVPYTLDGFVSQPGRLMLHIMVDDITLSQYPVKLRLHIEGNGIRITTNPNTPQQPVYLDGGVVTQLTGPDLELFFNPSNLLFQGYSQSEYNRNGRLPEGVYRIRFEVLDYYRDFQVSSAIPAVAMLSLTGAPVLTFPANRSEVDIDMTPVLRFSWMAVFSAIPDALISYRFRLWQIRPDNRDPYEIVRVTSPLYETTTHETALLYDGSMPPLTRGSRYVWQVTAVDEAGKVLFKNNGDSDIFTLRYGKQCAAPSAVITKVTHNSVAVSWNSDPSVREYAVRYKKENATGWQEVTTRQAGITIEGLDHSALYELTVTGNCGTETSENERVLRFKTDRFVDYSCGASAPGINLENREPLPALHRFDEFMAAGFYIEVTEVSGSNGVFSGRGIASVPYLNFLQFEVVFNGITINSDHRMIDGKVVFVYDEATGMIIGGDMGRGDDPAESGPEAYNHQEALEYIAGQVITLDEDVQTVTIDNKGQVTVVTESGQKKSYLVGENQTLAIITPQSTTVVDQASGQAFHLPNTPPGGSSDVRSRAQSKLYGCEVSFRPSANSRFGFDAVGNGSVKPASYFKRDRGGNAVPWKSLETGNSDLVTMLSTGDCPPDSLRLIRESGILTPTKPGSNNTLELLLTGGFEGQEELLTVARATLLHINDTTGSEILTEAGALGVVTYRRSTQNVVLVPVNSAGFPTQGTDRSVIIRRLNEIYGAAVVSWNVHIDNPIEVGRINEEDFKVEGTALLSKYTSDMNRVIRAYKRDRVTDDNTMYLFFMEIPNLGSNRKGFMPLAGNYGFIFNFEARDLELIAHELAHGVFNLRHTFSDKAQHYFPQNQTANLMDYAGGTELWKYQWDLIHNPERILFAWGQDESEGAQSADVQQQLLTVLNNAGNNAFLFLKICEEPLSDQEVFIKISNQLYKVVAGRVLPNGSLELVDAKATYSSIQTKFTKIDNIPTNEDAFFILGRGNTGIVCIPDDQTRYDNYCTATGVSQSEEFLSKCAEDISKCRQPRIYNFSSEKDIANQEYLESLLGGESVKDDPTGQRHTLKGWLVLTDETTTSEDYAIAQSLAPPAGEAKIWVHKTDEGWNLKSELPQTINEFKNLEDIQGNKIYDMAKFAGGLALETIDIVATAYYEIYDATAKGVRKLRIPNYAWDDTDPDYSRMYAYVYKFVLIGIEPVRNVITYAASETLANEIQSQAPQVAAILRKFGDGRIEFAFMCGVWNGAVETVASVPDLLKLTVAPMSSKGRDDFSKLYTSLRDFKLEENGEIIDSGVWCAISTGFKQQFNTDLKIAEGTGEIAFVVALCFIDPAVIESAGAKTFAQVIKVLQKLDSFSETLSPATYAIHFTKDLTGKLLSKTRNRVCAVIKDGVLNGKAISSKGKIVREFNEKLDDISLKAENGEIKAIKGGETYDLLDDMPGYELKETAGYGVFSKVTIDANGKYTERIYALKGGDGASPSKFFEEIEANALAKNATDIEIIGEAIANPTFKENQAIFKRWGYKFETVTENGEELIKLTKKLDNIAGELIKAATDKFGKTTISKLPNAFIDNIETIVKNNGWTMETFTSLMNKRVIDLTPEQIATITNIRKALSGIDQSTVCQKVLTNVDANKYMKNEFGATIQGSIARAQDTKHLINVADYYDGLRLDFDVTSATPSFNRTDDFVYVIRFKSNTPTKARISNTTDIMDQYSYPYTGNGFTAGTIGTNGKMGVPEFFVDKTNKMEMTEAAIFKLNANGSEEVVSVLDEKTMKFINIE